MEPVVVLRDVVKRFRTAQRTITALEGLSAEIEAGRITGLVGPDGAGKTTLMRLLTGLLKPEFGLDPCPRHRCGGRGAAHPVEHRLHAATLRTL